MKRIEKNIKKRYKAIFAAMLSIVILLGIFAAPNGAKAKTLAYDSLSYRVNDYIGNFFCPGDVVDIDDNSFLHVRYCIYTGVYDDVELEERADTLFTPFVAAWGSTQSYEDIDNVRYYKSDFTFPAKPDTGSGDIYVYEVFGNSEDHWDNTLVGLEGSVTDCSRIEVLAYPAHRVVFHDKDSNDLNLGFNYYLYETPIISVDSQSSNSVYLTSCSDGSSTPSVASDNTLGTFLGWANDPDFFTSSDNPDIRFFAMSDEFDMGGEVTPDKISSMLNFYPVYECYETTLEVSAEDIEEGKPVGDNLSIQTNRPSDKTDFIITYEKINDDGTKEAVNGEPKEAGQYQVIVKLDKSGETLVNSDGMVDSRAYSSASASAKFSIKSAEEDTQKTEEEKKEETKQTEEKKEDAKLKGSVSISMDSFYYGGKAPSPSISSSTNDISKAVVKYKRSGSDDSTYSASVPSEIGTYTASVTVPANEKYEACSNETTFTISYLPTPKDAYTLEAQNGNKGYYISDVKIIPKKGFEISYGDRRHYSGNPIKFDKSMNSIAFFLRDETTLEETAVIVIGNIKIDNTAPKILDMQKDGLYFGDDDDFLKAVVSDENIDHVLLGEKSVELKSDEKGNMTFDIPVEKKKTTVTFTVFDEAGNKSEISIKVAPGWRKDGRIKKGRLYVPKDEKSIFTEGNNWGTVGKKTVYIGGNDFYPVEEGEYEFEVR